MKTGKLSGVATASGKTAAERVVGAVLNATLAGLPIWNCVSIEKHESHRIDWRHELELLTGVLPGY